MRISRDNLGSVVRNTRRDLSLTQSELASKTGCSQRLISELENGSCSAGFEKVLAVLEALGIGLEATPLPVADPQAEIDRLSEEVAKRLAAPTRKAPRLSEILEEEK